MSDSVKKYHEMVEDGLIDPNKPVQSPLSLTEHEKALAYRVMVEYDEKVIKYAYHKIMFG